MAILTDNSLHLLNDAFKQLVTISYTVSVPQVSVLSNLILSWEKTWYSYCFHLFLFLSGGLPSMLSVEKSTLYILKYFLYGLLPSFFCDFQTSLNCYFCFCFPRWKLLRMYVLNLCSSEFKRFLLPSIDLLWHAA